MEIHGVISSSQKLVLGCSGSRRDIITISNKPLFPHLRIPGRRRSGGGGHSKATSISALSRPNSQNPTLSIQESKGKKCFARITSLGSKETTSVGVSPQLSPPPPPSHVGSPLFWVGVGVGLSVLFSTVATYLKNKAMQQAFKSMMGSQNNQFTNAPFPPGSPFPFQTTPMQGAGASPSPGPPFSFPTPPTPTGPTPTPSRVASPSATAPSAPASERVVTVDVPPNNVEASPATPPSKVEAPSATNVENDLNAEEEPKKFAFVDVSPDETLKASPIESFKESYETDPQKDFQANQAFQNGAASNPWGAASQGSSTTQQTNPLMSMEALEKMFEDPKMQEMVYPYLPQEMRNPDTFKWMLQNPQYRQELQSMLQNPQDMLNRMDSLKNFDINSPEVKQQFDQIGLTPEEVFSKIMDNPEVAMAFQNPRVQQAIMDCSQNPMSITKYQNDKEVMDVFNKISELFPGVSGR